MRARHILFSTSFPDFGRLLFSVSKSQSSRRKEAGEAESGGSKLSRREIRRPLLCSYKLFVPPNHPLTSRAVLILLKFCHPFYFSCCRTLSSLAQIAKKKVHTHTREGKKEINENAKIIQTDDGVQEGDKTEWMRENKKYFGKGKPVTSLRTRNRILHTRGNRHIFPALQKDSVIRPLYLSSRKL